MTTEMEKKMIGAFYALTEEKANWEKDLIASNHRNLDLQYIVDDQADQIATLKAALIEQITQDKIAQMGRFGFVLDSAVCDPYEDTKKQLARKYPDVFGGMECSHNWVNMAPNNHMTCSKCGEVKE